MNIDLTGLTEVKMRNYLGRRGAFYYAGEELVAKTCSECQEILPRTEYCRGPQRGLNYRCRSCDKRRNTLRSSKNASRTDPQALADLARAHPNGTKACSACKESLPLSEFPACRSRADGLHWYCRSCANNNSKQWSSSNRQYFEEYRLEYYEKNRRRTDEEIRAKRAEFYRDGVKHCSSCNRSLPLGSFPDHRARADGLSYLCKRCSNCRNRKRREIDYLTYWGSLGIRRECYMCAGPYEQIEHLIPQSHPRGLDIPENTRPACAKCNGSGGKWYSPLEHYIFSVSHPTKTRAQILYEIVMSGTWPFALTTPEEFVEQCKTLEEAECISK